MTKPKHQLWYNPSTGEYHDTLEEGCLAYIKQTGLVDFYSGSYGDIDKVSVNGETYHAQDVFPSKQALIESLLTEEERLEMAREWGDGDHYFERMRHFQGLLNTHSKYLGNMLLKMERLLDGNMSKEEFSKWVVDNIPPA